MVGYWVWKEERPCWKKGRRGRTNSEEGKGMNGKKGEEKEEESVWIREGGKGR